jgi:hypothetical protein
MGFKKKKIYDNERESNSDDLRKAQVISGREE